MQNYHEDQAMDICIDCADQAIAISICLQQARSQSIAISIQCLMKGELLGIDCFATMGKNSESLWFHGSESLLWLIFCITGFLGFQGSRALLIFRREKLWKAWPPSSNKDCLPMRPQRED
jgi:hypothetical protein